MYSSELEEGFEDVSAAVRPEMSAWLSANDVDKKIVETTVNKMVVGTFNLPKEGRIAVAVLHCKSFKTRPELQGLFVAHAIRTIGFKFGCPAYCVGDMNIEGKWPKGTSAQDQASANSAHPSFSYFWLTRGPLMGVTLSLQYGGSAQPVSVLSLVGSKHYLCYPVYADVRHSDDSQ